MALARQLGTVEQDLDKMIARQEEILAQAKLRNGPNDKHLIEALESVLSALLDAHVYNTDARSFERAYRKG